MTGIRDVHVFVTGASRGIGAAIAAALGRAGARVTLAGRDTDALEWHARTIRADGGAAATVELDVTDEDAVDGAFAAAAGQFGTVRILVNCAGHAASGPVVKTPLDTWSRVLAVNLTGAFLCSRRALPAMLEDGRGRIVNIASTAGLRGVPHVAAYSASKHGLIGLTRSLALEVAKRGVTVNAVCPGYTRSDMAEQAVQAVMRGGDSSREEAERRIARTNALGRLLEPEEVAQTVLWLCSDEASTITGEAIVVGG